MCSSTAGSMLRVGLLAEATYTRHDGHKQGVSLSRGIKEESAWDNADCI